MKDTTKKTFTIFVSFSANNSDDALKELEHLENVNIHSCIEKV